MKGRFIAAETVSEFKEHFILEERSAATVEKYIRDDVVIQRLADELIK